MGSKLKLFLKVLVVGTVLFFLGIFLYSTDFEQVCMEIRKIGYRFLFIILISFIAYLLGTWCWKICLGTDKKQISLFRLFTIRHVCETVGLFNPTSIIGGDALKVYFLKKQHIHPEVALSSVVLSRITVVLSQIALFILSLIWLIYILETGHWSNSILYSIYGILSTFISIKILFILWMHRSLPPDVETPHPTFWQKIIIRLRDVRCSFQRDKAAFWHSYVFALLHWIVGSIEFYLILIFLGYDVHLMHGLVLDMSVIVFKSIGAFVPGQLGVEELGNKLMLTLIGIGSASLWVAVSILRRARQLFWIFIGSIMYLFLRKDIQHAR